MKIGLACLEVCLLVFLSLVFLSMTAVVCCAQSPAESQTPAAQASDGNQESAASQSTPAAGQQGGPGPSKDGQTSKDAASGPSGTSKDRLFFALPNFLTLENSGNVPPLTAGEKFKVVAQGTFDPIQLVWYGALSSICQAENCEKGYGQGWAAYGKRYGTYAADGTIENFFVGAILPSMLHQDPRYFQSGHGSFFHRTEYSVSRIFWTRTDSGHGEFNYSEIVGSALAAAISTYSYHPHPGYHPVPNQNVPYIASDRTFKNTASVWGSQVGYDTITLVIKEFWPDIRRKIRKHPH